jgi:hypothetical protein
MHAVVRTYSGAGANEFFDLLEKRSAEIDPLIRSVPGFVSYSIIRTADGGITVTVCEEKTGVDESIRIAREWIQENASEMGLAAPTISEGRVAMHLR